MSSIRTTLRDVTLIKCLCGAAGAILNFSQTQLNLTLRADLCHTVKSPDQVTWSGAHSFRDSDYQPLTWESEPEVTNFLTRIVSFRLRQVKRHQEFSRKCSIISLIPAQPHGHLSPRDPWWLVCPVQLENPWSLLPPCGTSLAVSPVPSPHPILGFPHCLPSPQWSWCHLCEVSVSRSQQRWVTATVGLATVENDL